MKRDNKKKFMYCILITLSYVLILTCNLEAATLTVGSGSGLPGAKNILIPINLSSAPSKGAGSFNFDLNFDTPRLTFKTVTLGPKAIEAGKSLSHIQPNPNIVRVIVIGFNQNIISNGTVLNFTFDILNNAPPGKADLIITKPSVADPAGKLLPVTINNGSITVEGGIPGTTTSTTIPQPPPDTTTTSATVLSTTSTTTIETTTSINPTSSSTTTSVSQLWPLLYDEMWGSKKDQKLFLLRTFRDEILVNTEVGKEYMFMLYSNSFEILVLLLQDPIAVKLASEVADEILVSIQTLLYHDEMTISQKAIDNFESLLSQLEPKASPNLKIAIAGIREDFKEGRVFKQLGIRMQ